MENIKNYPNLKVIHVKQKRMMNRMMGKNKFAKVWRKVIAGYKHHIETGEEVNHKTKLDISPVKLIEIEILN